MSEINNSEEPDGAQKLRSDLDAVMERVQLCREIMLESPGIQYDDTLAGVIGFLEACRDRLVFLLQQKVSRCMMLLLIHASVKFSQNGAID